MVRALLILIALSLAGCEAGPDTSVDLLGENVFTGAVSNDARVVVIGGVEQGIHVFVNGVEQHKLQHSEDGETALAAVGISPNGRRIVTATGSEYIVWSSESGRELIRESLNTLIRAVAVDNRGRVLAGALDGAFWLDPEGGSLVLSPFTTRAVALDGKRLMVGDDSGLVTLWNAGERSPIRQWQVADSVETVAFYKDQGLIGPRNSPTRLVAINPGGVDAELPQEKLYYPQPVSLVTARVGAQGVWTANGVRRLAYWNYNDLAEPTALWRISQRSGSNPGSGRITSISADGTTVKAVTATGKLVEFTRP